MGEWGGASLTPTISVHTDFTPSVSESDTASLASLWSAGGLSRETLWSEMKRRSVLSDSFDDELEAQRIEDEAGGLQPAFIPESSGEMPDDDISPRDAGPIVQE